MGRGRLPVTILYVLFLIGGALRQSTYICLAVFEIISIHTASLTCQCQMSEAGGGEGAAVACHGFGSRVGMGLGGVSQRYPGEEPRWGLETSLRSQIQSMYTYTIYIRLDNNAFPNSIEH